MNTEKPEGHYNCAACGLPITWDGGLAEWVHWWEGAIYCPDKTRASVLSLPYELREGTP